MYALSTLVMTHRESVQSLYSSKNPAWVTESELNYTSSQGAHPDARANGESDSPGHRPGRGHSVSVGGNGQPLVITRQHAVATRRISYDPTNLKIRNQAQEFRTSTFLERMHRRRGYKEPYTRDDIWGFTVDAAVVAMIFWSLSGIWMWWELRRRACGERSRLHADWVCLLSSSF